MQGFKTLIVSAALFVFGMLEQSEVVQLIPADYQGLAIAVIATIMAALRLVTKTPVTLKDT